MIPVELAGCHDHAVRLENLSAQTALPTPFSPGVLVVHTTPGPYFTTLVVDRGAGRWSPWLKMGIRRLA